MTFALALLLSSAVQQPAACPLGPDWGTRPSAYGTASNTLSTVYGPLSWNGSPVTDKVLRQYLAAAARLSPRPAIVIDTAGMPCSERRRVAALVEAAGGCPPGLCRAYRVVRGPPPPAPPKPGARGP